MTLEQLRIFVAAAELLSMTRAAERLHLTQPAVSAAIGALEERYATRLFDRIGRRLALTEAGRLFLPEAAAVLDRAASARQILDDLSGLLRGEVRIAASQTVASFWLPARMARFVTSRPHIQLKLFVGNTSQAAARVLKGEADLLKFQSAYRGADKVVLDVAPHHRPEPYKGFFLNTRRAPFSDSIIVSKSMRWVARS